MSRIIASTMNNNGVAHAPGRDIVIIATDRPLAERGDD